MTTNNIQPTHYEYVTIDPDGKEWIAPTPRSSRKSEVSAAGDKMVRQMISSGGKAPSSVFLRPCYRITLSDVIKGRYALTGNDIDQLVDLLTHRCRHYTNNRVRSVLTYGPKSLPHHGIFERVYAEAKGESEFVWHYCAGQDYVAEIRTVRELIVGR